MCCRLGFEALQYWQLSSEPYNIYWLLQLAVSYVELIGNLSLSQDISICQSKVWSWHQHFLHPARLCDGQTSYAWLFESAPISLLSVPHSQGILEHLPSGNWYQCNCFPGDSWSLVLPPKRESSELVDVAEILFFWDEGCHSPSRL